MRCVFVYAFGKLFAFVIVIFIRAFNAFMGVMKMFSEKWLDVYDVCM